MLVTVSAVTGGDYEFDLESSDTVTVLKSLIWQREGVPPYHQGLIFHGQQLDCDERSLGDYGIVSGSRINLALLTRSGPAVIRSNSYTQTSTDSATGRAAEISLR